jgi:hypothetical protein
MYLRGGTITMKHIRRIKENPILIIFALFIIVISVLYFTLLKDKVASKQSETSKQAINIETTQPAKPIVPDLEVLSKTDKYNSEYDYAIIGEIKNNKDYPMRNVFIRINLYDKDYKLLGDAIDRIDILDANGIWKFKAPIMHDYIKDFDNYKVVELTGYK